MDKIGFIGAGNMGSALVGGLLSQGIFQNNILVADHREENCQKIAKKWGVGTTTDNAELAAKVDVVILAVKPKAMKNVIEEIAPSLAASHPLVVSIAAGITTQQIQQWGKQTSLGIVRAMPNTPALLGKGITGLFATPTITTSQRQRVEQLLSAVGQTVWLPEEDLMDVVTALSGSGPAYFFYIMEGLIKGAINLGLSPDTARKLTFYTALGSAHMALEAQEDVEKLRERVTSPGGTTEQGINILKNGKLLDLLEKTLEAATQQGKALRGE